MRKKFIYSSCLVKKFVCWICLQPENVGPRVWERKQDQAGKVDKQFRFTPLNTTFCDVDRCVQPKKEKVKRDIIND